jgi:biopolymer transport protein TolR
MAAMSRDDGDDGDPLGFREHLSARECPMIRARKNPEGRRCKRPESRSQTMSMMVGARRVVSSEINVTPLIDVLLVLLIIFMVILPQQNRGESAQIPQPNPDSPATNPPAPIVIQLKDVGEGKRPILKINQEEVSWDSLAARLQAIYRAREDRVAFVQGDPEIEFAFVAEVVDVTHLAGAERVGLMGKGQ